MSAFSSYTEVAIFNHLFRNTAIFASPVTVYLGLSTADPLDDASGLAEPVAGAYARQVIAFNAPISVVGTGTSGDNSANIIFPTATGIWGIITHGAIFDALVAGNMLCYFQWAVAKNIGIGDTYTAAIGDVVGLIR